jgi:uncharacterized Zn finger protein (UPF0148 family)
MNITTCPYCKMKVIPKEDGTCPSCQSIISQKEEELITKPKNREASTFRTQTPSITRGIKATTGTVDKRTDPGILPPI